MSENDKDFLKYYKPLSNEQSAFLREYSENVMLMSDDLFEYKKDTLRDEMFSTIKHIKKREDFPLILGKEISTLITFNEKELLDIFFNIYCSYFNIDAYNEKETFDLHRWNFRKYFKMLGIFGWFNNDFCQGLSNYLGENKTGLELMAGKCLLSIKLENYGFNMICTDNKSWEKSSSPKAESLSAFDSFQKYKDEIDFIILSWCPYAGDNEDFRIIEAIKKENLDIPFIVIHDVENEFTNSIDFWENSVKVKDTDFDNLVKSNYFSLDLQDTVSMFKHI